MDTTTEQKLQTNIANSWKMYSVKFVTIFSGAVSALAAWFLSLPADCAPIIAAGGACTTSQLSILEKLSLPAALLPMVAAGIAWYLRVKPQSNLTPAVALAKSDQPSGDIASPVANPDATVEVPPKL